MDNIIGIRREDLSKKGEQRVAVTPKLANKITQEGHKLIVQGRAHPEEGTLKRAFEDRQYEEAGAVIQEDLGEAQVIIGLKEIEVDSILPQKAYFFFSHTHKGQTKNRNMLQTLKDREATVIDYELITNAGGQRLITAFTYFAGYAGMIDTLWAFGERMKLQGISHPFQKIPQSIEKEDLGLIKGIIKKVGEEIKANGTPSELPPMINCILGTGKTSIGSQEIFDILPVKEISLEDLKDTFKKGSRKLVYKLILDIHQMFRLKADAPFDTGRYTEMTVQDQQNLYFKHPKYFESNLEEVLPYCPMLMNCILWGPEFPRTIPNELMAQIWKESPVLQAIGDITCDPNGSIEFSKETWIDDPVYIFNPLTEKMTDGFEGKGIAVMAVTNLPCEFSADASSEFSRNLDPLMNSILKANFAGSFEDSGLCDELAKAVILWKGEFTPRYDYMAQYLEELPAA